ncbi:uncharacterized protein [Typha latifolia]|uniref:uncharacterized protein n=1 Tax=Typha latifolia TaxID=4733 RepID=UPI003C306AE2
MTSATASKRALLADDVPWRATAGGKKPVPRIHQSPVLRVAQNPGSAYALAVMKHPDPIGEGFAMEAKLEAAGPECIVPGQITPVKLLGLKVWPIDVNFKFMEPVGRELRSIGKFMDSAFNLMNASFQDR